jgi:hypothetical protein
VVELLFVTQQDERLGAPRQSPSFGSVMKSRMALELPSPEKSQPESGSSSSSEPRGP